MLVPLIEAGSLQTTVTRPIVRDYLHTNPKSETSDS